MLRRLLALAITLCVLLIPLAGCSRTRDYVSVGVSTFSGTFHPLFATSEGDLTIVDLVFDNLLTTERGGQIILNGIEGETIPYDNTEYTYTGPADITVTQEENASTTVTITLRDNMQFSDGSPVTADDLLFTYYVLCDDTYEGYSAVKNLDIVGLRNYQTQTPVSVYSKYQKRANAIYENGWPSVIGDDLTDESTWFWTTLGAQWKQDVVENIDYCVDKYSQFSEKYIGFTPQQVAASKGLQTALAMVVWNGNTVKDGVLSAFASGKTFDLSAGIFPDYESMFDEVFAKYEGDVEAYAENESANLNTILEDTVKAFVQHWGPQDSSVSDVDCSFISGIRKCSDSSIAITLSSLTREQLYTLLNVYIAPLAYYGDADAFDDTAHQYGFTRGDLDSLKVKTDAPIGSGAYTLDTYDQNGAELTANLTHWRGIASTSSLHLMTVSEIDRIANIADGTLDIATVSGANNLPADITAYNVAEKLSGNVITSTALAGEMMEYIGLNTEALAIGDAHSSASIYLRRALITLLDNNRETTVFDIIGYRGATLDVPVSFDSAIIHAQPNIAAQFNAGLSLDNTSKSATERAVAHLISAGYTFDEDGEADDIPEGGRSSFSAICLEDTEDKPSPANVILEKLKDTMDTIGFTLTITKVSTQEELDRALQNGKYHLFVDTWTHEESNDLSKRFAYDGTQNYFRYKNDNLDNLFTQTETVWDAKTLLPLYGSALEIVAQACIVVPVYQEQQVLICNTEWLNNAVDMPAHLTAHWDWKEALFYTTLSA